MFAIFNNPWMYFWVAVLILVQNILRAFPAPDPTIKVGFGSSSPGYKFFYVVTQGVKGDITAIGLDPKMLTKSLVKMDNGEIKP